MDAPFRFMDLPRELRLMVYEFLPVKTTHHTLEARGLHIRIFNTPMLRFSEPGHLHTNSFEIPVLDKRIKVVHQTIEGLSILRTSKEVYADAIDILHKRLVLMSNWPIQIITNSIGLKSRELKFFIRCLTHNACESFYDSRKALEPGHREASHANTEEAYKHRFRTIHIAIRDCFQDEDFRRGRTLGRMTGLETMYGRFQGDVRRFFERFGAEGVVEQPTRDLKVVVRFALLSEGEIGVADAVRPLRQVVDLRPVTPAPELFMGTGVNIGEEEWNLRWAEGERAW
ncbi:hypothetical protein GQ44DRAFT_698946 [Phaeosphaeriaceae sp. PMI808]|nr:hypothetical protein GQ44DRAFT_698946 [Phaeosphaeriaceae sp. PMI808]